MCHPELIHPKHASLKDDILHVSGALKKAEKIINLALFPY